MTTTTYLELDDQANGANNNTWGDVADANMGFLELAIARFLALSTTGGSTTLTTAQNRYPLIRLTGVLASNATIVVRTAEKHFVFINDTTGAFTVTVKTSAGTGKTLPRGRATRVYCDGTNVSLARHQAIPHAAGGGTVDAITATFEPAFITAEIQDGTIWAVEALGANTVTTPTYNPDATGALTIKRDGAQALLIGDIPRAGYKMLLMYDASGGHVELLNPAIDPLVQRKSADLASAGTVTVLDDGDYVHITGTTTITDLDFTTARNGRSIKVVFDGILLLTHHATTLVLPGAANITTAAGDTAEFVQDSSDNIKCLWYTRAATAPGGGAATRFSSGDVKWAAYSATPSGFLPCDGAAVSRTTYADLFTAISTNWGVGDGSTTFNVPDLRGRVAVGAGTGTVAETQAAANFATSDIITVTSNTQNGKPKWQTGMPVVVTTDGVLPTGIAAATTYYVRRLSATTLSLYNTLANAMAHTTLTTGRVNITATGSGNHTMTSTLTARTLADLFGHETSYDMPSHSHRLQDVSDIGSPGLTTSADRDLFRLSLIEDTGDTAGISNMTPSAVLHAFIKT